MIVLLAVIAGACVANAGIVYWGQSRSESKIEALERRIKALEASQAACVELAKKTTEFLKDAN